MNVPQVVDGIEVYIDGLGPAIVMMHGWPDTYRLWDPQVQALQGRYRCIRFTLPGFDVGKPRRAVSLIELVALLRRVVQRTCPGERVTLMLHDWGCVFGYEFAMRHPELVARIVGVDIGDAGSRAHRNSLSTRAALSVFAYQVWLAIAWRIGGVSKLGERIGDRMTRWMARAIGCRSDPRFIGSAMNYPYDIQWTGSHGSYRHALRFEPKCPMLFVWGRRKPFQFHSARWVDALRTRPGCRALEFDCGHWVMTSKPHEFSAAVAEWLEATDPAAGRPVAP